MNKKSYIIPSTQEIKILTPYLMTASPEKIPVSDEDTVDDENDLLSRKIFSLWDEE